MSNESSKLYQARANYQQAEAGNGSAPQGDEQLDEKRHNRNYNPVDEAKRGSVSGQLNEDSARYRKGPGPF